MDTKCVNHGSEIQVTSKCYALDPALVGACHQVGIQVKPLLSFSTVFS